jgi:hypothetical protein
MQHHKWNAKPFAVVHPRRGQKYRVAQLCAALHTTGKPSVEQLADVFGISPYTIRRAIRMARRPKPGNGQRPIGRKPVVDVIKPVTPMPVVEPVRIAADPWAIAEDLVQAHGVDTVFDRLILPAIS